MGASNRIYGQIAARMGGKPTEELIEIWQDNDRGLWSDQAFRAIKEILINRGIELPVQGRIKRSEPAPRPLIGDFLPNYVSWAIYFLFLFWIAVLHPFFYIGSFFSLRIRNPLHPDLLLTFMEVPFHGDGRGYFGIWQGLTFLELGILCLGIYVGYLLTEKKGHALSLAKTYLIYLFSWILLVFFLKFCLK